MPKLLAEDFHANELADDLRTHGLKHLRVRRHGELLTIESGDKRDPFPHARLRRESVHLWRLEMPTDTGGWEPTPFRDQIDVLLELLLSKFAWTLAPVPHIPMRTSGRQH